MKIFTTRLSAIIIIYTWDRTEPGEKQYENSNSD